MPYVSLAIILPFISTVIAVVYSVLSRPHWDPRGRHCYITGGSTGLGLALAILLTKRGADVSIVARNEENLKRAMAQLEAVRVNPNQILKAYSFSLGTQKAAVDALEAASLAHGGQTPDAVFLCAGKATPGFFIDETEESMRKGMDNTYWLSAWSALAASKRMVRTRTSNGKIVFVSSLLGYFGMIGYSTYSPGKHAIRGLAETLRQELLLCSIDVHLYMPGTMYSPGYEEENKTKPELVRKIEESDEGLSPERAAEGLYQGVRTGEFHITDTLLADIFRTSTRGASPYGSNILKDLLFGFLGTIALPLWRRSVDKQVIAHREAHAKYLTSKMAEIVE
ncbi:oxidoreductase [Lactarius akahatsu]|uniref:Oxidoreductase n=1 Tax=Lactarius akahatsu TaxID=416441 RepID=A0AAD4LTX7_9AGAM|nr:oxidoreductase [Lactarius akahatsu]